MNLDLGSAAKARADDSRHAHEQDGASAERAVAIRAREMEMTARLERSLGIK
jgi:hypothetical protein